MAKRGCRKRKSPLLGEIGPPGNLDPPGANSPGAPHTRTGGTDETHRESASGLHLKEGPTNCPDKSSHLTMPAWSSDTGPS